MGRHDTSNISKTVIDVSEISQKCRLRQRKEFFVKRKYIADVMLFFCLIGIILMILLVEFNLLSIEKYRMNDLSFLSQIRINLILKYLCLMTTLILLALVFAYHWMDLNIFCINNSITDWRISITFKRLFFIFVECIAILIHPVPFNYNVDTTASDFAHQIQYDVILSLPMFARTYLLFRVMLLNSKVVNDACSQSIGFLNKVKINFKFYFKRRFF